MAIKTQDYFPVAGDFGQNVNEISESEAAAAAAAVPDDPTDDFDFSSI